MRLFQRHGSAILGCDKPVICRVNGMRIGGGQEIGMAVRLHDRAGPGELRAGRPEARLRGGRRRHRLPPADDRLRAGDGLGNLVRAVLRPQGGASRDRLGLVPALKIGGTFVRTRP